MNSGLGSARSNDFDGGTLHIIPPGPHSEFHASSKLPVKFGDVVAAVSGSGSGSGSGPSDCSGPQFSSVSGSAAGTTPESYRKMHGDKQARKF